MGLNLFLGLPLDEEFHKELAQTNPYLSSLLIGPEEYLQKAHEQGKSYLGKCLAPFPTLDQIEDIETHVLSLLKKLVPHYAYSQNPLLIVTLSHVQ